MYSKSTMYNISLRLQEGIPPIPVNEFVIWEILEPLLQNSIAHNFDREINIVIATEFCSETRLTKILIADDGSGIREEMLQEDKNGVKKIFQENVSSSSSEGQHFGYGCFIAHNMATRLCGWKIDVKNRPEGGCVFTLEIKN